MVLVNAVKSLTNAAARAAFLLALPETLKDLIIAGMSHQEHINIANTLDTFKNKYMSSGSSPQFSVAQNQK